MNTESQEAPQAGWVRRILIGRNFRLTLVRMAVWAVLLLVLAKLVLVPVRVQGISMLPTYQDRRVNFVNRLAYAFHPPQRGDVVAIKVSDNQVLFPHVLFLKRIIAMPGETISFKDGDVYINGRLLEEPYLKYKGHWTHEAEDLGPDEYFFVGDNRVMGWNDHEKGRATRRQILGKILW